MCSDIDLRMEHNEDSESEHSEDLWLRPDYIWRVRKYQKLVKKKQARIKLQSCIRKVVPKLKACIKIQAWIRKMKKN